MPTLGIIDARIILPSLIAILHCIDFSFDKNILPVLAKLFAKLRYNEKYFVTLYPNINK